MNSSKTISAPKPRHSRAFKALYGRIRACTWCTCSLSNQKAPGVGNEQARVLLLGQNPGRPHPGAGFVPFDYLTWETGVQEVGSGIILQAMLKVAKIPKEDIYITNVQKCGGSPDSRWVTNCADWLEEELTLLRQVQLIITLGRFAQDRMGSREGHLDRYDPRNGFSSKSWLMTSVTHPAAINRPRSIGLAAYEKQWRFVGACYRQLERV